MRLKITEGDLIIIGAVNKESAVKYGENIDKWLKARGLTEVAIMIGSGQEYRDSPPQITVLSVNDVFQDVVLDGKKQVQENKTEES